MPGNSQDNIYFIYKATNVITIDDIYTIDGHTNVDNKKRDCRTNNLIYIILFILKIIKNKHKKSNNICKY